MAELRANHFHAGIDIGTNEEEGYPVLAAADGYVYRLKISSFGYGRVLYMRHLNGYVTVYAHLRDFEPRIEQYLLAEQYRQERFDVELFPDTLKFFFRKGQQIGSSGNSGSSGGPHLHFEVRTPDDLLLNPCELGFAEISDSLPPVITGLAVMPLDPSSRVLGRLAKAEIPLRSSGPNQWEAADTIIVSGTVGIEFAAHDRAESRLSGRFGINRSELRADGESVFYSDIQGADYDQLRYIQVHTDYEHHLRHGKRWQRAYLADGNKMPVYQSVRKGRLHIAHGKISQVELTCADAFGNRSTVRLILKGHQEAKPSPGWRAPAQKFQVIENALVLYAPPGEDTLRLHTGGRTWTLLPAYREQAHQVFIHDLRRGLPNKAIGRQFEQSFSFVQTIPSETHYSFFSRDIEAVFTPGTVYDTVYLQMERRGKGYFFAEPDIPLYKSATLTLRTGSAPARPDRTHVYALNAKGRTEFVGGKWQDDAITFQTKYIDHFVCLEDLVPPTVKLLKATAAHIRLQVQDERSGIAKFRAELNGKFLLLYYDHKTKQLWARPAEEPAQFGGRLEVWVEDKAGNVRSLVHTIGTK